MINKITTIKIAVLFSIIISMYFSISFTALMLLLGLLLIPPLAVIGYTSLHGIPFFLREIDGLMSSGKDFFLISVSKKNITLEPQFR